MTVMEMSDEAAVAGNKGFHANIPLGGVVELFGDRCFRGVVTCVKFVIGRPATYLVEWRDGRGITERWMTLAEIQAYAKLEE